MEYRMNVYKELEISEQQIAEGKVKDARSSLSSLREKYLDDDYKASEKQRNK